MEGKPWWNYIGRDLQELIDESLTLLELFEAEPGKYVDYSFVVFPAAKAYEGFLKKLFLDMKFISEDDYYGKRFRIGKALNPFLDKEIRAESVYDKIVESCGGKKLADILWETWTSCRNKLFHWFPNEKGAISILEARAKVELIVSAFDEAAKECKLIKE